MNFYRCALVIVGLLCVLSTAKITYFWHVSDTHVKSDYQQQSNPDTGCYEGTGNAGKYGDYKCDPPAYLEQRILFEIPIRIPSECSNDRNPLFVLYTGDTASTIKNTVTNESVVNSIIDFTTWLMFGMVEYKPEVPFYVVIGNHDTFPQDQMDPINDWVYSVYDKYLGRYLPQSARETFRRSGYYYVDVNDELRLIGLNTVLYSTKNNKVDPSDTDPAGQIAWLEQTLADAKSKNKAVYIAGHIPILGFADSFRPQYIKPLLAAMKPYQDIIKGSFWGHHHVDMFHLLGDSPENSHVAHLAGSITPNGFRNPSCRRYLVDTSNKYAITSWRTFYSDIDFDNKKDFPLWSSLYETRIHYGFQEVTPKSIMSFIDNLKSNQTLFDMVLKNRFAKGPGIPCDDDSCRKSFICSVLYTVPEDYKKCISE